jgi:dynein heavy chain
MQARHWKRLNGICGKIVNRNDPKFCLRDIIDLELYKFSEDVNELVEGAGKEQKIETKLGQIIKTWDDSCILHFKPYKDTQILDTGMLEEIVENVDIQSMDLMTMNASKDSEEFKEPLQKWQKILKTIDQVLVLWVKVQKNWMRLEPIFLASEDIRAQLPEDTKRFEKVDAEWKGLMADAVEDAAVVAATNTDGRDKILQEFITEIDLCEKALNEYLEQKKKIFPRFYFVSNQALLDILSNGNNPEKVNEYLSDCFDGMRNMKLIEEGNRPFRQACGMYAKDGEYVEFDSTFTCTGAVENYLCDLERKMQETLKKIIIHAKDTTDDWNVDKPRELWLDDYCAQLALLGTQIEWTEATVRTFDDLESGSESAMKEHLQVIRNRISKLIGRVRGELTKETRVKVITIITIDVHARDVIKMFCDRKIVEQGHFAWAS